MNSCRSQARLQHVSSEVLLGGTRSDISNKSVFENWITKPQLARALSVSISFVNKMMLEGLPHLKMGRAVRFRVDAVVAWLQRRS
jgi:excisionase family DNA binding protein